MTKTAEEFFVDLNKECRNHVAVKGHSFLKRFAAGDVSPEGIKKFAEQYYLFSRWFTRYLAAVVANTPHEDARRPLVKNLWDEIGLEESEGSHPNLFRRFVKTAGVDMNNLEETDALPCTMAFIDEYLFICKDAHYLEAMGALGPGTETVVPYFYKPIFEGLKRSGKFSKDDIFFFEAHIELDAGHGHDIQEAIMPHANTEENQKLIAHGARKILDIRTILWDGLEKVCCPK
ncbi:MAG: iron-containing redox enzyme family protein [Candidatus Brocadiales bacterium]